MEMKWYELLDQDKLKPQTQEEEYGYRDFPINVFEQDYHKIISSSAFRRLQDKTQVYPLDDSDFARTRLTHSIEVSTIAYQMGQMLTENTIEDVTAKYKIQLTEDEKPKFQAYFQALKGQFTQQDLPDAFKTAFGKLSGEEQEKICTTFGKLNKDEQNEVLKYCQALKGQFSQQDLPDAFKRAFGKLSDEEQEKICTAFGKLNKEEQNEVLKYCQALRSRKNDVPSLLRCAGVLHDLGNPPFGHFGEATIGLWFQENLDKIKYKDKSSLRDWLRELNKAECRKALKAKYPVAARHEKLGDEAIANLEKFEGNAQALRLLCKAQYAGNINVSYAVISSLVKYPTDSRHENKKDPDIKLHKQGVYASEADAFDKISEAMGTRLGAVDEKDDKNPGAGEYCRHPLTFIMEASDDIAYATSDLEDSYKRGMFTLQQLREHFEKTMPDAVIETHGRKELKDALESLRKLPEKESAETLRKDLRGKTEDEAKDILEKNSELPDSAKEIVKTLHKFDDAFDAWRKDGFTGPKRKELKGMLDSERALTNVKNSVETLEERWDRGDQAFSEWLNRVRARLKFCVVYKFLTDLDKIMAGTFTEDMFVGTFQELTLAVIKSAMGEFVYDNPKNSPTEISGHNSLSFLLDGFVHAALYADETDYKNENGEKQYTDKDNKYWRLISEHFRKDYDQAKSGCEPFDLYLRLLTVTDHISAMTDTYAHDLAAKLRGY